MCDEYRVVYDQLLRDDFLFCVPVPSNSSSPQLSFSTPESFRCGKRLHGG